ncbi:hypothetical protein V0288_20425 [Pannus brasiliensis CCIBt3594]|uniref:Uncharacterized protein n=1 Tax=Pannus brasiliensis CCIBt3594 TaxID=1427578 RepID=A0AAW9QRK8_9CHRO
MAFRLSFPEQRQKHLFGKLNQSLEEQIESFFESQLKDLGLAKDQIETQSLDELQQSLETVNQALKHPESFGTLRFKISAEVGAIITSSQSDAHFERGILQLLLSRKKLILERIRTLSANEKIESIQDLINKVDDEELKVKLNQEVVDLRSEAQRLREQSKEVDQEQTQEAIKTQTELERLKIELFERRTKVWFSLLERESAATIIGGILLLIILVAHVTAIFSKFSMPEILNNAFLIILGYFFGQSTNDTPKRRGDTDKS